MSDNEKEQADSSQKKRSSYYPEELPPVRRFFKKYILPDRDLHIGTSKPDKDNLRQVEKDYYVLTKARQRAHYICAPEIIDFSDCSEREGSVLNLFKCRDALKKMNKCLVLFASDDAVVEQSKRDYLEERRFFETTGQCLNENAKEERRIKHWIDAGKLEYLRAKAEAESKNESFDWLKHCKYTRGRNS